MKRILLTLLCLGVLGMTGCYVDPALYGPASIEVGVGAYVEEEPYYYPYRGYYRDDDNWRHRRWERERWRDRHYRHDRWR